MNDPAIQQFALQLKQKTEFQAVTNKLASDCWDQCITYTIGNLDSKQERCLSNCVQRFIDASKLFTQKLEQKAMDSSASQSSSIHEGFTSGQKFH